MNMFKVFFTFFLITISFLTYAQKVRPQSEDDFYQIRTIPIPEGVELEVGGLATMPDGRLGVSTRRGEVWIVDNPYMTGGSQPYFTKFASGLHEVLGLAYKDGAFYCTQRGELTKLVDTDGDGRADIYEPVYQFELSGNYHEYAYGPIFDKNGDMYVTLNVAWVGYGDGLGKWHGWLLKISPDGSMQPIATGLRSPAGFTLNSAGDVFYAENQGDWVGSGRVTHLEKGDFAGNAGGLNWTKEPESPIKLTKEDLKVVDTGEPMHEAAKKLASIKLPAVWFPHTLMGISTADILEDTTKGAFGPFAGQYFVADQGHSKIMRMSLEKVKGKYQGACYPFREGFASGLLRLRWGQDGSLFGGMTSRGWASTGKAMYALQRLEWTGTTPFEIKTIQAKPDGFEVDFTLPVDKKMLQNAMNYQVTSFTYKYHHEYGSPIINQQTCNIKGIIVSEDGKKVRLVIDGLREGYIHEVKINNLATAEGAGLLHNVGYYTLNAIPDGEKAVLTASQMAHNHQAMAKTETKTTTKTPTKVAETKSIKNLTKMPASWGQPDQVLTVGTKPNLNYSVKELQVKAGSKVKLVFNNNDDMTHNLVIVKPNTATEIGKAAENLGLDGTKLNYVPNSANVLFHTKLLQPNSSEAIYFIVPTEAGTYTYVCTYPGHASVMQGVLKVVK
jgi:azurin